LTLHRSLLMMEGAGTMVRQPHIVTVRHIPPVQHSFTNSLTK